MGRCYFYVNVKIKGIMGASGGKMVLEEKIWKRREQGTERPEYWKDYVPGY